MFFQISLISGKLGGSWILLSAAAFSLLCYHTACSLWRIEQLGENESRKGKLHIRVVLEIVLTLGWGPPGGILGNSRIPWTAF